MKNQAGMRYAKFHGDRDNLAAISRMTSSLAGWPKASTGRMAFVGGVMASSMRFGSTLAVSG